MFANNLRRLRESKGLTYRELADTLNKRYDVKFSKSTIQRWEENDSSPSITHATALAHYFNVTLDELSGSSSEMRYGVIKESETRYGVIKESEAPHYYTETVAAHMDDDLTDEEVLQVRAYIAGLKANRK